MREPVRVAVTGAAGQIGYSLLFQIAAGEMLGPDQPVILQLLEISAAMPALRGVVMELQDCAFPLLAGIETSDDPTVAFKGAHFALLVGSRPRSKGMERKDLLEANGAIFTVQGKALAQAAHPQVKVLVVGNPANTNALIALRSASGLPARNFTAMLRLDHNRAVAQLAAHLKVPVTAVERVAVWGNHSSTQYPDLSHALVEGRRVWEAVDLNWIQETFIPTVQKRGAAIIEARGFSSAASAANAAIDHMRDWVLGTGPGQWVSMGVLSDGSYGIPEGVVFGFPVTCQDGEYQIVPGLEVIPFAAERIQASHQELLEERAAVAHLL